MKQRVAFIWVDILDTLALEEAKRLHDSNFEIYFFACDKSIGICRANCHKVPFFCQFCTRSLKKKILPLLKEDGYHYIPISSLISLQNKQKRQKNFSFNTVKELKDIKYKGIDVGYAAFSTFVSLTRNITPNFNDNFKNFITELINSSIKIIDALHHYILQKRPDIMVVHNARFSTLKPFYQLAKNNNIDYIITEHLTDEKGKDLINNFHNSIPHSEKTVMEKMVQQWNRADNDKYQIAKVFFENRRFGKYAGDKIYTANQKLGELPQNFDDSKINIAIFNSSEDEYFSVSKECDDAALFPSQYEGLKKIFDNFADYDNIHFFLRIHPNLADIKWKSHTLLYNLKYKNVTIIPPTSSISSYTLMDACNKIIVFNSTIGLESVYWGKPVIALNESYYNYMGLTYVPKDFEELQNLILTKHLRNKKNDNCLIAGYYVGGNGFPEPQYYKEQIQIQKTIIGTIAVRSQFQLLRSSTLHAIVQKTLSLLGSKLPFFHYYHLPQRTA